MGGTASGVATAVELSTPRGLEASLSKLSDESRKKLLRCVETSSTKSGVANVLLSSNGASTPRLQRAFMRALLGRHGIHAHEFAHPYAESLETLREMHKEFLQTLKIAVICAPSYFKSAAWKAEMYGTRPDLFFEEVLPDMLGVKKENIRIVTLFDKPWIFSPGVLHDKEDEDAWKALIAKAQARYDVLEEQQETGHAPVPQKETEASAEDEPCAEASATDAPQETSQHVFNPPVRAQKAGHDAPAEASAEALADPPQPQLTIAEELFAESKRLDEKYAPHLDAWCRKFADEIGLICSNGGNPCVGNLAWQISRPVTNMVVELVRSGKALYIGRSAGSMVTAKSIQMSKEVTPEFVAEFSCRESYHGAMGYSAVDLDDEGVHTTVLGALPLIQCPLAMRPHFDPEQWAEAVLRSNQAAEAEFEAETGREICDETVAASGSGAAAAIALANMIAADCATQDNPVFIPLRDGQLVRMRVLPGGREEFSVLE